jgi:hypothetical protein
MAAQPGFARRAGRRGPPHLQRDERAAIANTSRPPSAAAGLGGRSLPRG